MTRRGNVRPVALAAAALSVAVAGCRAITGGDDRRPPPSGAWFGAEILTGDGVPGADGRALPPGGVRIMASFGPGIDERGAPRTLTTAELRVDGTTYGTSLPLGREARQWTVGIVPRASLAAEPLVIEPPQVAGVTRGRTVIRLTTVEKAGPDTVRVGRGAAIRIPLRLPATPTEPATPGRWWAFALRRPEEPFSTFSMGGAGLPPAELIVPAELLEPAGAPYVASFSLVQQANGFTVDGQPGAYSVSVNATTRLEWRVESVP